MREINGYVFVAAFPHSSPMFGKKVNITDGPYENFESNGFVPFDGEEEARNSSHQFQLINNPQQTSIGPLKMILAEKFSEHSFFEDKSNLVVVMEKDDGHDLIGPWVKGSLTVTADAIGAVLRQNNYQVFNEQSKKESEVHNLRGETPYRQAIYTLNDVVRQWKTPCLLATFDLTLLD